MIKSVSVITYAGDRYDMVLREPWNNGFLITSIGGIGPVKASINTTPYQAYDGERYNSAIVGKRNITLNIRLLEVPTIEDVRHEIYKAFPVKGAVTLIFVTDTATLATDGYVESNEPDIFSQEESVSISIICPDPYFYGLDGIGEQVESVSTEYGLFEFPFEDYPLARPSLSTATVLSLTGENENKKLTVSNELVAGTLPLSNIQGSVTRDNDTDSFPMVFGAFSEVQNVVGTIEFSISSWRGYTEFDYQGISDVPMEMTLTFTKSLNGDIKIVDAESDETMTISCTKIKDITGKLPQNGDVLFINTKRGSKEVTLTRENSKYNCFGAINKNSDWLQIKRGDNRFGFLANDNEAFTLQFRFKVAYEGV